MRYEPIPSLEYRYEIDMSGRIRNVKTKRILKYRPVKGTPSVTIKINDKKTTYMIPSLIWEVFGVYSNPTIPVGVTIKKGGEAKYFKSLYQCSIWLEQRLSIGRRTIQTYYFHKRRSEIYGWQIIYHEPEKRKPLTVAQANGDFELRR